MQFDFLNPHALWLLPLAAALLFVRRRQPPEQRLVGNIAFWSPAADAATPSPTRRRRRTSVVLLLQMAFMLAVIAALARPVVRTSPVRIALVLDASASMGAKENGSTRLGRATERAVMTLDALSASARVHVWVSRSTLQDLGEFSPRDPQLRAALHALTPSAETTDIGTAVIAARAAGASTIHVFSDAAADTIPPDVRWAQLGTPQDNTAIMALSSRHLPEREDEGQVLAHVRHFGRGPVDTALELTQDGATLARLPVHLDAGQSKTTIVDVPDLHGVLTARLDVDDALAVDNVRYSVAPRRDPIKVVMRGPVPQLLAKALASNPQVRIADANEEGRADVLVCGACDTNTIAAPAVLHTPALDASRDPVVAVLAGGAHAIARNLDRTAAIGLSMASMAALDREVAIWAGPAPAVIARRTAHGREAALNFHVDRSPLALTPGFPVLVADIVEWLACREPRPDLVAGGTLEWPIAGAGPFDGAQARPFDGAQAGPSPSVEGPGGRVPHRIQDGRIVVANADIPGVYRLIGTEPGGPALRSVQGPIAVNAAVEVESDLSANTIRGISSDADRLTPAAAPQSLDLFVPLLFLALAALAGLWLPASGGSPASLHLRRGVIALCLILAASGLAVPWGSGSTTVLFILDRSDSIPHRVQRAALSRVNELIAAMPGTDRAGLVVFGSTAAVEMPPSPKMHAADVSARVSGSGTNIAAAIRLARLTLPRSGHRRIVLISDGRETEGDAAREAAAAIAAGVSVDALQPPAIGDPRQGVRLTAISAAPDVRTGEPFVVTVHAAGAPGETGLIHLKRDGDLVLEHEIEIGANGAATVAFEDRRSSSGVTAYEASLTSTDPDDDRRLGTVVTAFGVPNLLYVSTRFAGMLSPVLTQSQFRVSRVIPRDAPATVAELDAFDAIVLDDVPAEELTRKQLAAIKDYVEQRGGGVLLLGGPNSLSPAGYPESPLAPLLPVDLRPRSGGRSSSVAMVLAFDKSGSMADAADGVSKIELARQSALKALDVLPATDQIGIIAFDAVARPVVPLSAQPDRMAVDRALQAIDPGGPTAITPAIHLASGWLQSATATRRHVLLMSDGRTSPADAAQLTAAVRKGGFVLSVVAIGADADRPLLQRLADSSGGRAYFPQDIGTLPLVVAREAARVGGGAVVRENFMVRTTAHPVTSGLERSTLPRLGGYVAGALKPGAEAILLSHLDDPILSGWRVGLGRVAVYTGALGSDWSSSMDAWRGFGTLWTQCTRWVSRRGLDRGLRASVSESQGSLRLVVEAETSDGRFAAPLDVAVTVRGPDGTHRAVSVAPAAPGQFTAEIEANESGVYAVAIATRDSSGTERQVLRGLYRSANEEARAEGVDAQALERIAAAGGGHLLEAGANPFLEERPRSHRPLDVWLAAVALLIFCYDVFVPRRLAIRSGTLSYAPSRG